jgi:hypothetical protein
MCAVCYRVIFVFALLFFRVLLSSDKVGDNGLFAVLLSLADVADVVSDAVAR